jgi:hypothetical protein
MRTKEVMMPVSTTLDGNEAAMAAVGSAADIAVKFDGICYVDLSATDGDGNTVTLAVHREAVPGLIAALSMGYGDAVVAHVALRDGGAS